MPTFNPDLLVLGLGGTVDYEISWDNQILQELVNSYKIETHELVKSDVIRSERELVCTVLASISNSAGGETQVVDSEIVKTFSARFEKQITLGGTGVRAAIAMRKFGVTSTLHLVSIDDNVRKLLPDGCKYICSAEADSFDPHLIIQFDTSVAVKVGERLIKPSKADRIILTCDPPNEILLLSPELPEVLTRARVFLISGFNSIHEQALLELRLEQVQNDSNSLQQGALIFFEDAGYHRPAFRHIVMENISKYTSFFSMNEEELQNYLKREINYFSAESIVNALADIQNLIHAPIIIIHTKAWSVVLGLESEKYEACAFSGMAMATTRYIHGDGFTVEDFETTQSLPRSETSLTLATDVNNELQGWGIFIPGFDVDIAMPTTIGLGDTFVGGFLLELSKNLDK